MFTGTLGEANEWIAHFTNVKFGFTNLVSFPSARETHSVVKQLPLEYMLLETDAPYFVPKGVQVPWGFSHPGHALNTGIKIAHLKKIKPSIVLSTTTDNCKFIYGI